MNKKVYLSNLEWVNTHNNMGGVKADIVFKDSMTYDEYKELHDKTYCVLTDTNLEEKWNNLKKCRDKALKKLNKYRNRKDHYGLWCMDYGDNADIIHILKDDMK